MREGLVPQLQTEEQGPTSLQAPAKGSCLTASGRLLLRRIATLPPSPQGKAARRAACMRPCLDILPSPFHPMGPPHL